MVISTLVHHLVFFIDRVDVLFPEISKTAFCGINGMLGEE
jgi:hypothetical protein